MCVCVSECARPLPDGCVSPLPTRTQCSHWLKTKSYCSPSFLSLSVGSTRQSPVHTVMVFITVIHLGKMAQAKVSQAVLRCFLLKQRRRWALWCASVMVEHFGSASQLHGNTVHQQGTFLIHLLLREHLHNGWQKPCCCSDNYHHPWLKSDQPANF